MAPSITGHRANLGRETIMKQSRRHTILGMMAVVTGIAVLGGEIAWPAARAETIPDLDGRVVAINIPGASAIAQVGTFLNALDRGACANPIPRLFPSYIQPGAVLDPNRILVGSRSNFGASLANGVGEAGAFLSIDPSGPGTLGVPPNFARSGDQASALAGAVQMFSANSPHWLNAINNPGARREHQTVHRSEQSPRPLQQQRLWPHLAGERTDWRHRRRLVFDPRPDGIAACRCAEREDRRRLCGCLDEPRRRDHTVATAGHPGRTEHRGSRNSLARPIA